MQYAVDAQQRRTARLVNGVVTNRWLYQSQLAIAAEVDSVGNPVRMFNYGSHGNVPELMTLADGTQYRLITDHLGSVRLVIDVAADTVVQRLPEVHGQVLTICRLKATLCIAGFSRHSAKSRDSEASGLARGYFLPMSAKHDIAECRL